MHRRGSWDLEFRIKDTNDILLVKDYFRLNSGKHGVGAIEQIKFPSTKRLFGDTRILSTKPAMSMSLHLQIQNSSVGLTKTILSLLATQMNA